MLPQDVHSSGKTRVGSSCQYWPLKITHGMLRSDIAGKMEWDETSDSQL